MSHQNNEVPFSEIKVSAPPRTLGHSTNEIESLVETFLRDSRIPERLKEALRGNRALFALIQNSEKKVFPAGSIE